MNALTGNKLTPEDEAIMERIAHRLFLGSPKLTINLVMYYGTPNL